MKTKNVITTGQAYAIGDVARAQAGAQIMPESLNVTLRNGAPVTWFAVFGAELAVTYIYATAQFNTGKRIDVLTNADYIAAFRHDTETGVNETFAFNGTAYDASYIMAVPSSLSFTQQHNGKPLTLELAKRITYGTVLHTPGTNASNGKPRRYRVTSVKRWVRDPERVEVRVRYGIEKSVYEITQSQLHYWVIGDPA